MSSVIPIWQPVGFSTHKISKKTGESYGLKATHTGTLDPMAEGVVIVLTGEERFNKYDFAGWLKTYEFEMAFGLSTDSFDAMGMIQEVSSVSALDIDRLREILKNFKGVYIQRVPVFSAILHKGKRLFEYPHLGQEILDLPVKKGVIFEIELLETRTISAKDAVTDIIRRLESIVGYFRQDKIIEQWKQFDYSKVGSFPVVKIRVKISRGMYVRSLSTDIARKLGLPAFVYTLVRTENGKYKKADCMTLEQLFGENFDRNIFKSTFKVVD